MEASLPMVDMIIPVGMVIDFVKMNYEENYCEKN